MKIKYVTMTGADDNTSIMDMLLLSDRYPYAEWGILFSQARSGVPRYPSLDWVEELWDEYRLGLNLSAHLCGKWVQDAMQLGVVTFLRSDESEIFNRVQLNMNEGRLHAALHPEKGEALWEAMGVSASFILGGGV